MYGCHALEESAETFGQHFTKLNYFFCTKVIMVSFLANLKNNLTNELFSREMKKKREEKAISQIKQSSSAL